MYDQLKRFEQIIFDVLSVLLVLFYSYAAVVQPAASAGRTYAPGVAETLVRFVGAPRTRGFRARMMAANDLIAGFIGGAVHHAHALGVGPASREYRRLVKRTVLDLIVGSMKDESHGSEL